MPRSRRTSLSSLSGISEDGENDEPTIGDKPKGPPSKSSEDGDTSDDGGDRSDESEKKKDLERVGLGEKVLTSLEEAAEDDAEVGGGEKQPSSTSLEEMAEDDAEVGGGEKRPSSTSLEETAEDDTEVGGGEKGFPLNSLEDKVGEPMVGVEEGNIEGIAGIEPDSLDEEVGEPDEEVGEPEDDVQMGSIERGLLLNSLEDKVDEPMIGVEEGNEEGLAAIESGSLDSSNVLLQPRRSLRICLANEKKNPSNRFPNFPNFRTASGSGRRKPVSKKERILLEVRVERFPTNRKQFNWFLGGI